MYEQIINEEQVWSSEEGSLRECWNDLFESEFPVLQWLKNPWVMDQGCLAALYAWSVLDIDEVVWDRAVPYPTNEENVIAATECLADYVINLNPPSDQRRWAIKWDENEKKLSVWKGIACKRRFALR